MYSAEPFKILGLCVAASLLVEFLCWFIIYRTDAFRHLKSDLTITTAKIDALKAAGKTDKDKDVKRLMDSMVNVQARLYVNRFKVMALQLGVLGTLWWRLKKAYAGKPIAKLPFVPFQFVTRATHAGLEGDDLTEMAFHGMYALCSGVVRGCVSKFINKEAAQVMAQAGKQMQDNWLGKQE